MSQAASQSQYAQLLKPIKDLEKNWNVDITSCLDDYLHELDDVTITFDGGNTSMNFAQAALVVQSSTCVYSKKVEYLYSLVHQVLDLVTSKKKQTQKSSVDQDGNDEDADFADEDDDFLSLDDIPEGKDLYLKEDFEVEEKFQLLPQIPLCLIPLEGDEKGDNPLVSTKGEVLASRNDFKMNTCRIHASGTLLLDLSHLKLLEDSLKMTATQKIITDVAMETETRNVHEVSEPNEDPINDFPPNDDFGGGDDASFGLPADQPTIADPTEDHTVIGGDVCRGVAGQKDVVTVKKKSATKKHEIDPLEPLDPSEELEPPVPFVRSKCTLPCPGIEVQDSKKRKRTKVAAKSDIEPFSKFITRRLYTRSHRIPRKYARIAHLLNLTDAYWKECKRRDTLHREYLKKRKEANEPDTDNVAEEKEEELDRVEEVVEAVDISDNADNYDDDLVDDNLFNAIDVATGGNHSFHVQDRDEVDIDDCEVVTSYESLVRRHVEEYMASAQDYAQTTDLSKRVAEWEDKIRPVLEEEEMHEPFDINKYGSCVLDSFIGKGLVKFQEFVRGKPSFEICRIFLASLMLANTGNVKIVERGILAEGMDKFELELLSTKRHFEELQEYQAPSTSK